MCMKPPSHSTAELYAELSAAWANYKNAEQTGNKQKAEEIRQRIMDIQKELAISASEQDFKQFQQSP